LIKTDLTIAVLEIGISPLKIVPLVIRLLDFEKRGKSKPYQGQREKTENVD
jgi:hypothetical protein